MTTLRAEAASGSRIDKSPRRRILLIEDEPAIGWVIARALSTAGYTVDRTERAADGLKCASTGDYDLVLLDLVMPDLDGRVVLQRLIATHPDQAVVVLSCLADVTAKVECLDLGARDYLTKPFALDELIARVRVQLRSNGRGHAETI